MDKVFSINLSKIWRLIDTCVKFEFRVVFILSLTAIRKWLNSIDCYLTWSCLTACIQRREKKWATKHLFTPLPGVKHFHLLLIDQGFQNKRFFSSFSLPLLLINQTLCCWLTSAAFRIHVCKYFGKLRKHACCNKKWFVLACFSSTTSSSECCPVGLHLMTRKLSESLLPLI